MTHLLHLAVAGLIAICAAALVAALALGDRNQ